MGFRTHFLVEFLIAIVVIDTDGSAFITKAEFDSLKNNFQKQIDNYNISIDSKIDGAIASYLDGIRVNTIEILENTYDNMNTRIWFGSLPLQTTDKKYYVKVAYQMLIQHDGYTDQGGGIRTLRLGYKSDSTSDTSGAGVYNTYGAIDGSNYYWHGFVNNEYAQSIYNFTGVVMSNRPGGTGEQFTIPTDGLGKAEYTGSKPTSTTYGWGGADEPSYWYKFQPTTGGWSAKDSYWTRGDTYFKGTLTNYQQYVSGGAVANASYDMINIDDRIVDSTSATDTRTLTTAYNTSYIMSEDHGGDNQVRISVEVLYYYPKVKSLNIQNLYNGTVYEKLNRKIKLYEGLPLFTATSDGKVSFTFTIHSSNSSYPNATFYMRDNTSFANNDVPVGDVKMTVTSGVDKYTDVIDFQVADTKIYNIEMEVKKDHEYWFKIKPNNSSSRFNVDNFTDIKLTKNF